MPRSNKRESLYYGHIEKVKMGEKIKKLKKELILARKDRNYLRADQIRHQINLLKNRS